MDQQSPQKPPYVQLRKLHGSGKQEAQVLILASAPDSPTFLVQNIEFLNFLILQMKKKNHTWLSGVFSGSNEILEAKMVGKKKCTINKMLLA